MQFERDKIPSFGPQKTLLSLDSPEGKAIKRRVFIVSYLSYASLHAVRTSWAYVKPDVSRDLDWSMIFIGNLDMLFLLSYGLGLFINGTIGDYLNRRRFLATGMYMAFAGYFVMALAGSLQSINGWFMRLAFAFNGFGESTGWPGHISLIGVWFSGDSLKTTMGIWSTCINVGNVIGQQIGHFLDVKPNEAAGVTNKDAAFKWTNVILASSFLVALCAVLISLYVYHDPEEAGFENIDTPVERELQEIKTISRFASRDCEHQHQLPTSPRVIKDKLMTKINAGYQHFLEAWKIPGVTTYALCYAATKSAGYGIMFWLPTYLQHTIGFTTQISWLLLAYEMGQLLGGVTAGYVSDRLHSRALVLPFYLFSGVLVFMILTALTKDNYFMFLFFLFLSGICIGAPYNYINAAIAADLGTTEVTGERKIAASTIPGIIDGTGSLLAAITNQLIPFFSGSVFWIFTGFCLIGGSLLVPLAKKEYLRLQSAGLLSNEHLY